MHRPHTPLIARLRRRLTALTWLLALAIVAKAAMASSCLGDGLTASADHVTVSKTVDVPYATIEAVDGDSAPCWHAGSGGCHCSCVHAAGLPVLAGGLPQFAPASAKVFAVSSIPPPGVLSLAIRPPIA